MGKLFIYYSNTGNGDVVASKFVEKGYTIRRAIPKKDLPKLKFFKILIGGFWALIKKKVELVDFTEDISEFDNIVIGSPTWADNLACPILRVLELINLDGKNVSFVLYSASGEAKGSVSTLKERFGEDAKILVLKEPKENKVELRKIDDFLE